MNNPTHDTSGSEHRNTDKTDQLLAGLPAAYDAWEKNADDPGLNRISRRVTELLAERPAAPTSD